MSHEVVTEFRVGKKHFATMAEAEDYARAQSCMENCEAFLDDHFTPGRARARARGVMEKYFAWIGALRSSSATETLPLSKADITKAKETL
jgi:hypothetical protein